MDTQNRDHRSAQEFFLFSVLKEPTAEQGAVKNAEMREDEHVELCGWTLKWDGVALSEIRNRQIGFGPFPTNKTTERTL